MWDSCCGGIPDNSLEAFLEEVEAALLMGDENPCREPERWRKRVGQEAQAAVLDRGCGCGGAVSGVRTQLFSAASLPSASEGGIAQIPGGGRHMKPLHTMESAEVVGELSRWRGSDRRVHETRSKCQAGRQFHWRNRCCASAARRICQARSGSLREDTQPSRDERHQPLVAVSALRQYRAADHCAGSRECGRGRQSAWLRRAIGFLSN